MATTITKLLLSDYFGDIIQRDIKYLITNNGLTYACLLKYPILYDNIITECNKDGNYDNSEEKRNENKYASFRFGELMYYLDISHNVQYLKLVGNSLLKNHYYHSETYLEVIDACLANNIIVSIGSRQIIEKTIDMYSRIINRNMIYYIANSDIDIHVNIHHALEQLDYYYGDYINILKRYVEYIKIEENNTNPLIAIISYNAAKSEIIELTKHKFPWNKDFLALNHSLDIKLAEELNVNKYYLIGNPSISLDYIYADGLNNTKAWIYMWSHRLDLTLDHLKSFPFYLSTKVWSHLSKNPSFSINMILEHNDLSWNVSLFSNPTITLDVINNNVAFRKLQKKYKKSRYELMKNHFECDERYEHVIKLNDECNRKKIQCYNIIKLIILSELANIITEYLFYR